MNKPKAIFIDIDGTLFSHKHHLIPDSAIEAISYAKDMGALLFIATGRHKHEIEVVPDMEGLPIVTYGKEDESFFRGLPGVKVTSWLDSGLDIVNSTVNKWDGILSVLEAYGIDPGDVAAIGDADNDKEMLSYAGYSIAMGNADEDVKACAKFVTSHIDENGLREAIYHLYGRTS